MESKWLIETQSDEDMEAYRILEVGNGKAELKYIAMDEAAATNLIDALNWMDTFRTGMVGIPALPKPKRAMAKKKPIARKPKTI